MSDPPAVRVWTFRESVARAVVVVMDFLSGAA